MGVPGSRSGKRNAADDEKKSSLHTIDLRHHLDRRVVNNLRCFLLAIDRRACHKRAEIELRPGQNFSSACLRARIA